MANLHSVFAGIHSPNPFWLASAPPTDKAYNVNRAFEAAVQRDPATWFWVHNRWKPGRPDS
jgi:lauroyl/myristoyl acyltransferase